MDTFCLKIKECLKTKAIRIYKNPNAFSLFDVFLDRPKFCSTVIMLEKNETDRSHYDKNNLRDDDVA